MKRRSRWLALLAGIGLVFAMTSSVFAYHGQVPTTITVTPSKGTFKCDQWYTVRATVLDQNGNPIKGLKVKWSIDPKVTSKDKIDPKTSKTDRHGVAKTRVKVSCKDLSPRTIKATVGKVSGSAVVNVTGKKHHDDDDDHDGDHDGDHDDDHDGDHGGDGHHEDRVNKSVATGTAFAAVPDATWRAPVRQRRAPARRPGRRSVPSWRSPRTRSRAPRRYRPTRRPTDWPSPHCSPSWRAWRSSSGGSPSVAADPPAVRRFRR